MPRIVELARSAGAFEVESNEGPEPARDSSQVPRVRLGIARDAAFHFYYPDNLEAIVERGAEWTAFSPLADPRLPPDLDGLYFGGGYPEVYAARLADNATMLDEVRRFAASGRAIYAECGGLMYLGRALTAADGLRYPMAGILPIETEMCEKLKTLGYTQITWSADCLWGLAGETVRGHEFHYSRITADFSPSEGWRPACSVHLRRTERIGWPGRGPASTPDVSSDPSRASEPPREDSIRDGFVRGRIQAGYAHLHWASRPGVVRYFLSRCGERS